jgi:hypothetical protein
MPTCADCHELLLDYVYGLLEDTEVEGLQSHLAGCAACQEALAAARAQQNLLSRAALKIKQVPVFHAPAGSEEITATPLFSRFPPAEPPAAPSPARPLPLPKRRVWPGRLALGAAAAVLLAAGALYVLYHDGLAAHQRALADARHSVEAVDAQLANLAGNFNSEKHDLALNVQGQFLHVQILGPATYQGSAATAYRLTTQTPAGRPASANISVRLVARAPEQGVEQVLFQDDYDCNGELRFVLPARLSVAATMKPRLVVEVKSGSAKEVLDQALAIEPPSYLTHLCLDKNSYRIGESVLFRTVTLERFALTPVDRPVQLRYSLCKVAGQKLEVRKQAEGTTQAGGIGGGEFLLTEDLPEGDYLLVAGDATGADTAVRQAVQRLHLFRDGQPRLLADRNVYKPGDTVDLYYQGRRDQKAPAAANKDVTVTAMTKNEISGNLGSVDKRAELSKVPPVKTDAEGNARFKVPLPKDVPPGDVQFDLQVPNGKFMDKLSQTIRVVPPLPQGEFFPEGGDLVAGLPNRVFFRLHVPDGLPAGLSAVVEDAQQREVVKLVLDGEGAKALPQQVLGVFTFTPKKGELYRVRLTAGDQQLDRLPLPQAVAGGVTLTASAGVVQANEPLRIQVRATERRQVLVLATCRGRTVDQRIVEAGDQPTDVTLEPPASASGVLRVTVYDKTDDGWQPAAERLVYRVPGEYLKLSAKFAKETSKNNPGGLTRMGLEARTEGDVLIPAWLHAVVCDEKDPRMSGASLPAFFLMTSELRDPEDLEDASILLTDATAAPKAVDLFLGTQGWRRFKNQFGEAPAKLVASLGSRITTIASEPTVLAAGTHLQGIRDRAARTLQDRTDALARQADAKNAQLQQERASAIHGERLAAANLAAFEQEPLTILRWCVAGALVLLLLGGTLQLCAGLVVAWRARRSPRLLLAGAFACLLLAVMVLVGSQPLRTTTEEPTGRDLSEQGAEPKQFVFQRQAGDAAGEMRRDRKRDAKVHVAVFGPSAATSRAQSSALGGPAGNSLGKDASKGLQLDDTFRQAQAESTLRAYSFNPTQAPAQNTKERFDYATRGQYGNSAPLPAAPAMARGGDGQELKKAMDLPKGGSGGFGGIGGGKNVEDDKAKDGKAGATPMTAQLREYAPGLAALGAETGLVLWHPLLFAGDGTAQTTFTLSGKGTTYRITVFGHTSAGRLGVYQGTVK